MPRAFVAGWISLVVIAISTGDAAAQNRQSVDSAFARAQGLQGAAGRLLVDSVLTTMSPDSSMMYAEGLYWRARLTTVDRDAEEDYRRIVVEYPMSPRSGDALLALSRFEQARGEAEPAAAHLRRFLLENPGRTEDGRTALTLSQLLFDQHNPAEACATLLPAHQRTPDSAAELKNQMEYLLPRCRGVDTSAHRSVIADPSPPPVANTPAPVASPPTTAKPYAQNDHAAAQGRDDDCRRRPRAPPSRIRPRKPRLPRPPPPRPSPPRIPPRKPRLPRPPLPRIPPRKPRLPKPPPPKPPPPKPPRPKPPRSRPPPLQPRTPSRWARSTRTRRQTSRPRT